MERIPAPEESNMHIKWFEEANKITLDTLGDFVKKLMNDYELDYGSVVHAMAAGIGATLTAMNNSEQGGITGFQAGCLMWEILEKEFHIEWPSKLIRYEHLLFPAYEYEFNAIPYDIWVWLRDRANQLLDNEPQLSDQVKNHLKNISEGRPPYGFRIAHKDEN